ncbi:MAG TPA: 3-oxoacyl-[acyl-carrier-protein] reductase [Planctomycetota bacterium]|nr:3-oxoacyl-[acyl-carrier-protein] reductase [Planctomycetota bacterium]HRR79981.1 3-oxoacyl-[acyl-carrier-protein] reductase [Planctomycetota bacterium]HRT94590.1 3-oxoacyl-[acyl-carrier-protein] reductase [Planctomycetota bacterium]
MSAQKPFAGKAAIVTGGGAGIGLAIARRLAQEGADLVVPDYNGAAAEAAAAQLRELGVRALAFQADVADAARMDQIVAATVEAFGGVHILVNNAGITRDNLLVRMGLEQWDAVIRTNLTGTYVATHAVLPQMALRQRSGCIVSIASVIGLMGNAGQANYAASKAGVIAFTKTLAKEVGKRGVRVNAIAPGYIATEMTAKLSDEVREAILKNIPQPRMGTPEDVAAAVRFLCSDEASYITGVCLRVDGGLAI